GFGFAVFFFWPVTDVGLEHLVFEVLAVDHGFGHVVEADHPHQHLVVHHRHVAGVLFQHHGAHLLELGFWRAAHGVVVHHGAHGAITQGAATAGQGVDEFAEGEHAHQLTVFHH